MNEVEEIERLIAEGEGVMLEFKSAFNAKTLETLVAFSNTKGGGVIIGISDSGAIKGVDAQVETVQQWINEVKGKTQPSIVPDYVCYSINNKTVVILSVMEFPVKPVALKGRYFKRIGNSNHLMGVDELANMHLKSINMSWDSLVSHSQTMEAISLDKVAGFIREINRKREIPIQDEPLTVLKKFELAKNGQPTHACILLFTGDENPHSTIMAGRFADPSTIKDSITIRSDLFSQVGMVMDFIRKHINKEFIVTGEPFHEERWQYPLNALREIVINMIVHRNYQDHNDSIIKIYNDRIEFFNPGRLLEPLTVEKLISGDYLSVARNKQVASAFKEAGIIEKYGSGIQRIFQSFKQYGLKLPLLQELQHGFRVVVYNEKETVALQDTHQVIPQVTHQVETEGLSPTERLLLIMEGELSRAQLQQRLNLLDRSHFRKTYLIPALEKQFIEMTIPDKPNSRHQKYRLTKKGKLFLVKFET